MKKRKPYKKKSELKKVHDRVWELCKQIIRIRDKKTCQKCGAYCSKGDTSHVIPKGRSAFLKYDLRNLKLLCCGCHLGWWHKNIIEAYEWFKSKFPERYKYLKKYENKYKKWTLYELLEYEKILKDILDEMGDE